MNTVAVAAMLSVACLGAAAHALDAAAQEDPRVVNGTVQIGGLFPLTGDLASIGQQLKVAAELAVDDFNGYLHEQGAEWRVELVSEDTGTLPAQALEKMQSLHARGITLVAGPATNSSVQHVKGYADLNDMLLVSCCSTSPALAVDGDSVYRFVPNDSNQGDAVALILKADGIAAMVPLWRGDAYGDGLRNAAAETFEGYGGEVHAGVRYAPGTPDFGLEAALLDEYVQDMIDKHGADNVGVFAIPFDNGLGIMQSASGFDALREVRWYGGEALAQATYLLNDEMASEFVNEVDFTAVQLLDSPGGKTQEVFERVAEIVGERPISFVHPSYDSIWVLGKAVMAARSAEAQDVKAVFADVAAGYSGALRSTQLNPAGDLSLANYQVWRIDNNTWVKDRIFAAEKGILAAAEQPQGEVLVGSLYPLTGREDSSSYDTRDATALGAEHFNEFLDSISVEWELVAVSENSAASPPIALNKTTMLHSEGMDIIIGPRASNSVKHIKPYADINDMMIISCCSTAPSLAIPGDSVFRLVPDDSKQGDAVGKLLESEGIEVVVPIWRNDAYGNGLHDAAKANFESRGYVFDSGVRFNPDLEDFGPSVSVLDRFVQNATAVYGSDKVAVFIVAFVDDSLQILRHASEFDALSDVRWFGAETFVKKDEILNNTITREFVNAVQFTALQVAESDTAIHDMVESHFLEKNGEAPVTQVYASYDIAWLVGLSMLQSGSTDAATIRETLPIVASEYTGAIGDTTLNEAGDLAAADYTVWRVVGDKWVDVGNYSLFDDSIEIESYSQN